jgi:pleckstrin domain-containing family G protein 5
MQWCESQPECQRLKLTDYLAKPMQRLTKYPLLLKQIIKSLTEEGQRERMASVLRTVEEFVTSVNTALQSQLEVDTVKNVMGQLDNYSAIAAQGEMEKVMRQQLTFAVYFSFCIVYFFLA